MVSALWNACAAEVQDLESVQQQLKEPGVDLEIKDHTGTTALIQAVRNGHKDIIKALLAAGADINNASDQGKPETYTTDPEILALLQAKPAVAQPTYEGYPQSGDPNIPYDPALMQHYYYPPPPGHEGHYPPYPYAMMPPPDGQPPMPPFPPHGDANTAGGVHNLPPADVARTIPCRYFPVCRYGSSCIFLHPQPSYFSGPPPPAPSHYTPMYPPHPYYMMRPGAYPHPPPPPGAATIDPSSSPVAGTQSFPPPGPISYPPPPNGAPPFSPGTNGAPFPPPVNGTPFSNGAPYPPPTNGAPYPPPAANGAPFSPASSGTPYTPATNGTPSPFGPPPFSPGSATPYSATTPYTPGPPVSYPYPRPYAEAPKETPVNGAVNGTAEETQTTPAANGVNGTGNHLNGGFARRNGRGGRRESFGAGRQPKPPCLFFPSGRCRNGDDCRFPHVMPEPGAQATFRYPSSNGRFNGHRSRQPTNHQDGPPPAHIPPGTKLPFAPGVEYQNAGQRVPNADDFPVLKGGSGSDKPAPVAPTNGSGNGLTAAQVLQAPAPAKKGKADSEVVGDLADALSKVHVNGLPAPAFEAPSTTPEITAVGA
ncbi:RNA-binding, Nab2-type zinc finger [Rhizoctonia solani]|uniref:RNA-binding, Nab2-type zinc finger n=1 Tax=Rhizoctonia solani TaxID=456999 RepID=A0A8H7HE83_9AGAM|nr:RNA-binding, Nab2-type zinc finger [Rhizoctonia solani]